MNEKVNFRLVIVLAVVSVLLGGTAGFLVGRGNSVGSVGLELANRKLTATVGSLRAELNGGRASTERIRREQAEERNLIAAALGTCRSAGGGLQGVIAKMEILNNLIRELERRAGGDSDISGSE
jgi:hypothetical protein